MGAQQNVFEDMGVYVSDRTLHIKNDRCVVQGQATVYVTMPSLASAGGTADSQDVTLSGTGTYRAFELETTTADVTLRHGSASTSMRYACETGVTELSPSGYRPFTTRNHTVAPVARINTTAIGARDMPWRRRRSPAEPP